MRPLRFQVAIPRPNWFPAAAVTALAVMAILIGWTALLSPPNSADTMSYHLPRVLHWIQNGDVAFFPTSYLSLIVMPPAAEYMMLHAYLLSARMHSAICFSSRHISAASSAAVVSQDCMD